VVEGSTRAIPENWRRLHVRQKGRENKPDTFDICSAPCATKVVELTYEGDQ
jgi:hypothetical protein